MPTTYSAYRACDQASGVFLTPAIPNIIDVVSLAGLRLTVGSNIITVTSTAGLFPGMSLFIPYVPMGAFIHAVMSDTQIVAYGILRDATTGAYTVSADAADATLDVTTGSLTGHARGFNEFGIVTEQTDGTVYRNEISSTGAGWSGIGDFYNGSTGQAIVAVAGQAGIVVVPDQLTVSPVGTTGAQSTVAVAATTMAPQVSDSIAKVPPRPQTRWVHEYVLVASTGAVTRIRKAPNVQMVRTGASI
jgi:hypothetical protein